MSIVYCKYNNQVSICLLVSVDEIANETNYSSINIDTHYIIYIIHTCMYYASELYTDRKSI